jgi:hypothetical protein
MTRKATDILLDIEQKLDKLLAVSSNQDLLLKNLNNRIKSLESNPAVKHADKSPEPTSVKQVSMPGLKPGVQLNTESPKIPIEGLSEGMPEPDPDEVEQDHKPKGKRRVSRYVAGEKNRAVPVQQRVVYGDGKNVCLAKVEIFQGDKNIKSLKTNVSGKWTYALDPGTYKVSIYKRNTTNKPTVDMSYEVDIPESSESIQLDTIQIPEK